jgi:hypothetical protein
MMSGFEKEARNINIIVGICSIIMVAVLSSRYGFNGAVGGIAISLYLQFLPPMVAVRKKLGFSTIG